jgi:phosphoglycerate dehydrogenase-like enzyme
MVTTFRRAFGLGWEVVSVTEQASGDGNAPGPSPEVVHAAVDAEVYFGWGISSEVIKQAGDKLRWVHTAAAGVGGSITPELRSSRAFFTNSRGVHADPMADWVVAAIGFCVRGFHIAVAAQREKRWARGQLTQLDTPIREFADLRVGIVGYGEIGRSVARRWA